MTRRLVQSSRLWSVALVALLAFECVVCWVQAAMLHHHWLSVSFLFVPVMSLVPFIIGVHLFSRLATELGTNPHQELSSRLSGALALTVIASYFALTACVLGFL